MPKELITPELNKVELHDLDLVQDLGDNNILIKTEYLSLIHI